MNRPRVLLIVASTDRLKPSRNVFNDRGNEAMILKVRAVGAETVIYEARDAVVCLGPWEFSMPSPSP